MDAFWAMVAHQMSVASGQAFTVRQRQPLAGGCIHSAWRVSDGQRHYFVKTHTADGWTVFAAEAAGLAELAASQTVRVPAPLCWGCDAGQAWLALEYLPLGENTAPAMETLGRQLAMLHAQPRPYFGWSRPNAIGSTPQPNPPASDWLEFWSTQRLGFQLDLAARNGYNGALQRQGEALRARLKGLFGAYRPLPALLHGDLWRGNVGSTASGEPVLFDPAVYYGDRETDLAMTELFGGFPSAFYAAYREVLPVHAGYAQRRTLYNVYHVLNHLNLFGGGYRIQAERMIAQLLAELR